MGRMADARKRARRGGEAIPPSLAAPGGPASAPDPEAAGSGPVSAPEAASPEPEAAAADFVFPAEDRQDTAPPFTGERVELPSSGLAEDVLPRVQAAIALPVSEETPSAAPRIELPASGLAEEILARHGVAAGGAEPPEETRAPSAEVSRETPPAAGAGAHSLAFFAAPAQEQRAAVEATEHIATFYLDREEYGVDVRQVQEIRRLTEITTVPRAPQFIRGVINLRGRILPVLDLRAKLGLGQIPEGRAARIIVARVKDRVLGLLVDGASQVLKVPVSRIESAPQEVVERGGDYIRGVAKLDDHLIILVDLERLLAFELRGSSSPSGSASRAALGSDA